MFCYDIDTTQGTGQPSIFSNQIVVQLTTKPHISDVKVNGVVPNDPVTGLPMTETYENTYWDKKIPLAEVHAVLQDEGVLKAFGSPEAWAAAVECEANLATM